MQGSKKTMKTWLFLYKYKNSSKPIHIFYGVNCIHILKWPFFLHLDNEKKQDVLESGLKPGQCQSVFMKITASLKESEGMT